MQLGFGQVRAAEAAGRWLAMMWQAKNCIRTA